ncbi:hypothetical protein [Elizabethkingia phage TCUEAP3]|nr:hypothetical protein [Elizabethkingia phage TCUEAP3]
MDKRTKKRKNYNTEILNVLTSRYGYSVDFIRKSLRGDRVGEMPDVLKKEYKILENEANEAIKNKAESLNQNP